MVTQCEHNPGRRRWTRRSAGTLMIELVIALAIIMLALIPLAMGFAQEAADLRHSYQKAAAMELIDGEMEILMAGQWRSCHQGVQDYPLTGAAAVNLPPGKAVLTITGNRVRLEWQPGDGHQSLRVVREAVAQ
jgi:hypothetical protein